MSITHEDWIAALEDAKLAPPPTDPNAKTIIELSAMWGIQRAAVAKRVRVLKDKGLVIEVTKHMPRSRGGYYPCPAYKLVKSTPEGVSHGDRQQGRDRSGRETIHRRGSRRQQR